MSEPVVYLSDVVKEIPRKYRVAFVKAIKDGIKGDVLIGAALRESFSLDYEGRNGETKTQDTREYAVEDTDQYKLWKEQQLQHYARLNEPLSLRRYPSKADLEAGKFNLRELAQKQKAKNSKKKSK